MNENNSHIENENLDFLNQISKKNNFKTPAGYFEELASKLEKDLNVKNSVSPKRGVVRAMIINISIAAAVIIGVFIFKPSKNPIEQTHKESAEVLVDDYMDTVEEESQQDLFAEIIVDESLETEIAALYAMETVSEKALTSDDLYAMFEEDWDDSIYEF